MIDDINGFVSISIALIEGLHGLSTVDSENIGSHGDNARVGPETVSNTANIPPAAVIVTPSKTASHLTTIRINLSHLIRHTNQAEQQQPAAYHPPQSIPQQLCHQQSAITN